ncbi:hypothetical protein A2U01_0039514, partial [Trifolium medium]|nr:hypothetical protein [Trifolium medium]
DQLVLFLLIEPMPVHIEGTGAEEEPQRLAIPNFYNVRLHRCI